MRILHTVEFYYPHLGGAERVVQRISEELVRRGHDVVVATSWNPSRSEETLNGVRIVPFRIMGNSVRGISGEVERYRAWLRSERFDIILNYAAQAWPTDAALSVLPEIRGAKILAACGFSGLHGLRRLVYRGYYRMLRDQIANYDAIIYHSANGADAAFGRVHARGEQVVIPNGVDGQEFDGGTRAFRQSYGIHRQFVLLSVGNHYRVKGHEDLMQVMRLLGDLDACLVVIGEDPGGRRSCWKSCGNASSRDPRILILKSVPRTDLVAAYRAADLFLLTSHFEVAPLVLVEAMAAGCPFISYAVGNASELDGGLVVRGPKMMAERVRALLQDDQERRRLGERGKAFQRSFLEWEAIIDQYEHLYTSFVDGRRQKG